MARKPTQKQLYKKKNEYLEQHFKKVSPLEFYRDMFPEGYLEQAGHPEDQKPNAIFAVAFEKTSSEQGETPDAQKSFKELLEQAINEEYKKYCAEDPSPISLHKYKQENGNRIRYNLHKKIKSRYAVNHLVFDGMEELKDILKTDEAEFIITSPITYFGKSRKSENAYHLWGIAIDLDGVTPSTLEDLHYQIQNKVLPCPTYIVNSGNGLHIYYLFDEPIPLHQHLYKPLNKLKKALTNIVWNRYTSVIPSEQKQYQGIFQGFRCVGSQSKLGKKYPVTAFRTGEKGLLMDLNDYVPKEDQVNFNDLQHTSLEAARLKWPEWYEKRIIEGKPRGRWVFNRAVYDSWIQRIKTGAYDGNRYWCIAVLAAAAVKCDIEYDEALTDALELLPWLNSLTKEPGNEFTAEDVYDAFGFYEDSFVNFPIRAIEAHTKIKLPKTTRNHQKQSWHLEDARDKKEKMVRRGQQFKRKEGRPKGSGTAQDKVLEWQKNNPSGTKYRCIQETKLAKHTVYKWWDSSSADKVQNEE